MRLVLLSYRASHNMGTRQLATGSPPPSLRQSRDPTAFDIHSIYGEFPVQRIAEKVTDYSGDAGNAIASVAFFL
ncbi:MAG: hypothetical protein WHT09_13440 [Thermogutta sp.]